MKLSELVTALFQLDKDWTSRIVMSMLVLGVIWGLLGVIDSLAVRIQETFWGMYGILPTTAQEYYAGITLHAERDLFGFAQQVIYAIFIFFTIKLLNLQPRAKWLLNVSFILINISMMLMEGPIILYPTFNDNYFPSTSWYYLSPLGIPGYSSYVMSPTFLVGWILLDAFTYLAGIWIVYHYYIATKQMKEKLPVPLVFFLMNTLLFMIGYSGVTVADAWDIISFYGIAPMDPIANQIAFWIFGHAIVYMAWLPAIGALYLLIPTLAGRPLYSERLGRISAVLYLIFSNNVPIHHLYMVNLPYSIKILQEVLTYAVVVPTMMTFFNLWATTKGAKVEWNVISAFTALSFTGAIAAGVTGISNATISFDSIIHNSMWVVGHFHAMILLSIVPAAMAVLYFMMPMLTGREWISKKAAWVHFWGYTIGSVMLVVGMDETGMYGVLRRSEVFPRIPTVVDAEVLATVGALLAEVSTLVWFLNLIMTLIRGNPVKVEGIPLGQFINFVASYLNGDIVMTSIKRLPDLTRVTRGLSSGYAMGILGSLIIALSMIPLAISGDTYNSLIYIWLGTLTLGIILIAIPVLKAAKAI